MDGDVVVMNEDSVLLLIHHSHTVSLQCMDYNSSHITQMLQPHTDALHHTIQYNYYLLSVNIECVFKACQGSRFYF